MTQQEFFDIDLPSVTRILRNTKTERDSLALQAWRERVGEEEADRIVSMSWQRGKAFDEAMKLLYETGECVYPVVARTMLQYDFLSAHQYLIGDHYKGERDAKLGLAGGYTATVDFKTSTKPKKREWWRDEFLQLCAYNALDPCDIGMIINAVHDKNEKITHLQTFTWSAADMQKGYDQFMSRYLMYIETKS